MNNPEKTERGSQNEQSRDTGNNGQKTQDKYRQNKKHNTQY